MNPIIRIEKLSKQYPIGEQQKSYSMLREYIVDAARAPLRTFRRNKINEKKQYMGIAGLEL